MKSSYLATRRSDLLNKLSNNYPNFLKKDLKKLIDIFFTEIRSALKRNERVELRDVFTIEPRLKKARFARNPKTNEKIYIDQKYSIFFKSSKFWLKKINEEK